MRIAIQVCRQFSQLCVTMLASSIPLQLVAVAWSQDAATTEAAVDDRQAAEVATSSDDEQEERMQEVTLADGNLQLELPARWERVEPGSRIVEVEFAVPPAEEEGVPGRMTMMRSGGGVEANIARWRSQFQPHDETEDDAVDKREVDGLVVHVVDLSGTFLDRPRPFGPATERPGYRMLGAIIQTEREGDYFIKFYAPATTVDENAEAFHRMINELGWNAN